jgi:hypothetical protein
MNDAFDEPVRIGDQVIAVRTTGKSVRLAKGVVTKLGSGQLEARVFVEFEAQAARRSAYETYYTSNHIARDAESGWFKTNRIAKVAEL